MSDRAVVTLHGTPGQSMEELELRPGRNLVTGEAAFRRHFPDPTSLENDVLRLAAAIYATDIAVLRGDRELYPRTIHLQVPVVNQAALNAVREDLNHCLSLMSGDSWTVKFLRAEGQPESKQTRSKTGGSVLLFSGGLDSLAMAVELVSEGTQTTLVSHDSGNAATRTAQEALLAYLANLNAGAHTHLSFRVRGQRAGEWAYPTEKEGSQRTRSLLFVALGALVARRGGAQRILLMAENGQMAIHLPLTAARIGAFSTRTAYPEVLSKLEGVFSSVLDMQLEISNPYLYKTKAEVVEALCQPTHARVLPDSVSCWKASRVTGDATHCGACVPCLVRRIALEHLKCSMATMWARDLLAEDVGRLPDDDDGKKNLADILELAHLFSTMQSEAELVMEYPDLINRHFERPRAIEMYRRFAREAHGVLTRYTGVRPLM